jgi:carbonic anhydrase/acetyltransferase-like protein (isoleucine patch superfamily)
MVFAMTNIVKFKNSLPKIGKNVYLSDKSLVVGNVTIGDDCSVWPMAVIRGDMHQIVIGEKTNIQDGCILHITHDSDYNKGGWPLHIGSEVTIGHGVILHGCTLEDQCLIGIGSKILDGAIVRKNSMLAAGSLVTPNSELESGFLYMGSPAKKVRKLSVSEMKFFSYTANNYVKLKNEYLASK